MSLDQEMLKAYQRRWQEVAEIEDVERRQASLTQRWRKLNALLRMAAALGLLPDPRDQHTERISQRWNRLRAIYLAGRQDQSL